MTDEVRRVVVLKDPYAPIWYLRCAEPCGSRTGLNWCMTGPGRPGNTLQHPPHCYLGGALTANGARDRAKRCGWELAE